MRPHPFEIFCVLLLMAIIIFAMIGAIGAGVQYL